MVPGARIELARCCQRGILSPVRLPIPPSRPVEAYKINIIDNIGLYLITILKLKEFKP